MITYTIVGVPYCIINGPQNPMLIIKAPIILGLLVSYKGSQRLLIPQLRNMP